MATIILIVIGLIYLLFPMWCAMIMKLLCKSFSDKFIIRFLGFSCSLSFILNSLIRAQDTFSELDIDGGSRLPFAISLSLMMIFMMYFWCQALAKAGILIISKKKSQQVKRA